MKKIIALTGSVKGIKTQIALKHTLSYISKHNPTMETELLKIGDFNLEFSDGRPISDYNLDTQFVINKILEADAIIIATPTYQTSIPGALKNIFDLLPMNALDTKIAGIIVTAASPMYFLMAEQQLKPILSYMGAHVINKYVYIQDCDFIGEIGLDFHWAEDTTAYPRQLEVFEYFLAEAKKHQKICNIHTKGAEKEVLALLQKHQLHGQIIHWYSGPLDLVTDYLELGCFFTISVDAGHSTLTDQLINLIPTQQLLFETDGPTALEWVNGTPSWPDEILRIQAYVAQLKSCSLTELEVGGHLLMEQLK